MPLTDIGAALQISLIYFTILYLTGLGGLFSERSGIVNIGLEGLMIIGTVSGAWGARYFTDDRRPRAPVGSDHGAPGRRARGTACSQASTRPPRSRSRSTTSCPVS